MTLPTEGQPGHLQKHADIDTLIAGHTTQIAAGDVTNPASAAGVALSATFASKFQINVADFATPQLALDAATAAGTRVYFPPITYTLTAPLQLKASGIHVDALGATFTQATWGQAGFDLLNVNDCTLDVGLVQFVGTRAGMGGSFRGSSQYCFGAGVWANGDGNFIRNLKTKNMPVGVFFSSWAGTSTYDHCGESNRIGRLAGEGHNFGVLWVGQNNLVIEDVYFHDDIDDSGATNPTHALYCSATTSFRSTGGQVKSARCANNTTGQAFQFKYADKLTVDSLTASNCKGLLNTIDCHDLTVTNQSITGSLANGGAGAITMQRVTLNSQRPRFGNTYVSLASGNDEVAVSIIADDGEFDNMVIEANHSAGVNAGLSDVTIRGSRNRITSPKLRSLGAAHCRGIAVGVGAEPATDTIVESLAVTGQTMGVNVVGGSLGVTVAYDPTAQRLTGAGAFIATTGGAGTEQWSTVSAPHAALSTLGDNPALYSIVASTPTVGVVNMALQVKVTPRRNIAVTSLNWFSVVASGNYDIAIYEDATNARLWSKGATAWPAAGAIVETVTGVTMRAGRTYRIGFSADNATGTYRGIQAPALGMDLRLDGSSLCTGIATSHPLPATLVAGSPGTTTRTPLIIIQGT